MKSKVFLLAAAVFALILAGCGGDDHRSTPIVTDIVSDGGANDGDIIFDGVATYSVFLSSQSPFTLVPDFGSGGETRSFITFNLATVPTTASIQRATIFLPILRVTPVGLNASVALFPDMVTFPPLDTLTTQGAMAGIFNATAILQGPSFAVLASDGGRDVAFDATDAVIEANVRALSTLQVRLISGGGQVEIDDLLDTTTGGGTPLLRVEYF